MKKFNDRLLPRHYINCFVIVFSVIFIVSCNNKNPEDKTSTTQDSPVKANLTQLDSFPILYRAWNDIVGAFEPPPPGTPVRKVVFRFRFDGTNRQPTLFGQRVRQGTHNFDAGYPGLFLNVSDTSIHLPYPLDLGNIEFTWDEYESLRDNTTNPPQTYLVFIPMKSLLPSPNNSVTYKTAWSNTIPTKASMIGILSVGEEFNPSPPRDPN